MALGPTKILQYTLQGLFHPARKVHDFDFHNSSQISVVMNVISQVRQVYWKIYNTMYIASQVACVWHVITHFVLVLVVLHLFVAFTCVQDALVAAYPRLNDEKVAGVTIPYRRWLPELFI